MPVIMAGAALMGALASGVSVYDWWNGGASASPSQPVVVQSGSSGPSVLELALVGALLIVAVKLSK